MRLFQFIPDSIQAATSIGIGLMTALAGATEIHLVVHGKYTLVDMGNSYCTLFAVFVKLTVVLEYRR
jgi:xanthine/uracil/vitamin C permease (AzgA family)